mgnify:CR=1 FL=1
MAGFTSTAGVPLKLLPLSWQVAQPLTMPLWTIAVPGPKMLVDLWQLAQSALVGMCPAPCASGVTPKNAVPVLPTAWQVLQPLVRPLWFITPGLMLAPVWHSVHACVVGM